jgi:LysM repeat protein
VSFCGTAHVEGAATTVSQPASGSTFGKVTADAMQSRARSAGATYKVSKGDTLSTIAKKHGVDVTDLRRWNHLKNDRIRLGQVLQVSNG